MLAQEWADRLERAAAAQDSATPSPDEITPDELLELAAVMRDIPARLDRAEQVVNEIHSRVVGT